MTAHADVAAEDLHGQIWDNECSGSSPTPLLVLIKGDLLRPPPPPRGLTTNDSYHVDPHELSLVAREMPK